MRRRSQWGSIGPVLVALCALSASARATEITFESRTAARNSAALIHQAQLDLKRADLSAARSGFAAAIVAFEGDAAHTAELFQALAGLAATLNQLHEYEAAIVPARRALTIIRSRLGLYAQEQRAVLEMLIDGQSQLGLIEAASDDVRYLERVSTAAEAGDPVRHAATLTKLADWHCRLGNFFVGRDRHRQAIASLQHTPSEAALLSAHVGLARCSLHELSAQGIRTAGGIFEEYRGPILRSASYGLSPANNRSQIGRGLRGEAEAAVREAARLATQSTTLDARTKVDTLLFAGDWFQLKSFTKTARDYYRHAAQILSEGQSPDDRLDTPVRVLYAIPPLALRAYGRAPTGKNERFIVVEFTVRADGSVQTPRVIERNVTKSMVDQTLDALRAARYRPRVIDGRPVESQRVVLRQSFDDPRELSGAVAYSNAE